MKNSLLFLAFALISFVSCKKDKASADGPQVKLSATTFYKNGSEETKTDKSGSLQITSYAALINDGGSNKFLVNLGAAGTANTLSTFGLSFVFNQQTIAAGIVGTYSFPVDQAAVRVTLRNEVNNIVSENLSFPTRGTVNFSYDTVTKKIRGTIQNFEFSIIPNDPFNRYRINVEGTFSEVAVHN